MWKAIFIILYNTKNIDSTFGSYFNGHLICSNEMHVRQVIEQLKLKDKLVLQETNE